MFTIVQRDHVRDRVLELARTDPRVTAGALTGSTAVGAGDKWSDIDVAFGIADGITPEAVLDDWTEVFGREFGALDHFDLRSGPSVYRVFLLPSGLEIDVGVTSQQDFGARGPHFRALFGTTHQIAAATQPDARYLIGLGWHHVLHARSCIERGKPWQAEYWIGGIRDHTLALVCLRLGENAVYGRGIDRLPVALTGRLVNALVRSLDEPELRRALGVSTVCFISEIEAWDPVLGARLKSPLQEFGDPQSVAEYGG
ncbi:MAG: aminoglycoside 6-adenylyltransferase [Chloroflexota bacterium]|nr:aminoglycoside 6-adenylyltransferase [Chloroflexota bacterium]